MANTFRLTAAFLVTLLFAPLLLESGNTLGSAHTPKKLTVAPPGPASANAPMAPSWELPVPDTSAPFIVGTGDGFAVATRSGRLAAHAPGGGAPLWQIELGGSLETAPVYGSGRLAVIVYVGSTVEMVLVDAADGRVVSRQPAGGAAVIVSAIADGIVLADPATGASSLALYEPVSGSLRWKTPLPSSPSAAASQCGDSIMVGGADGTLMSLRSSDGTLGWKRKIGEAIATPVLCVGSLAWVGSADNRVHALRIRRHGCGRRWSYLTGGDISGRIVWYDSRVLFFSYDTYLYALESGNGHLAWKVRLGRRPQPESALLGDLLMVAPLNTERLEVFHLPDGAQTAALLLPGGKDRFVTPPVKSGRMIVIAAARYGEESSRLIGLDPEAAKASPGATNPAASQPAASPAAPADAPPPSP
ncbi:MAG TPA: PQQ-binding-like beta-propeller repeat protein, partial [Patescibacteria group bacterium]|nr:PQQ-binding-like beta-propeller repeat protein [Patescibacteria group bacterium]